MRRAVILSLIIGVFGGAAFAAKSVPAQNPKEIIIAFQKQKDPRKIKKHADELAKTIAKKIGMPVKVMIPARYSASVEAIISNKAHVAYVSSIPYLLMKREAPVKLLMAEVRKGKTFYDSLILVAKDSPVKKLADLKGKRMAFTSQTSTSGYVFPYSLLTAEKLIAPKAHPDTFFGKVFFAGGYDLALKAVADGQADAAAVSYYAYEGPKADKYSTPEIRSKLRVLHRNSGVPTHLIAARSDLSDALLKKLTKALMEIGANQPDLIADVYGASELKVVDELKHVQTAMDAINSTGLKLTKLVK